MLPYLSDPVVPPLYQQDKVTHEGWQCPLHSNSPVGTGTERWVSVSCLPDSKTLEEVFIDTFIRTPLLKDIICGKQVSKSNLPIRLEKLRVEKWAYGYTHYDCTYCSLWM